MLCIYSLIIESASDDEDEIGDYIDGSLSTDDEFTFEEVNEIVIAQ